MNRTLAIDIIKDMFLRGENVTPLMMYMLTVAFKFSEQEAQNIINEAKESIPTTDRETNFNNIIAGVLGGGILGGVGGYGLSGDKSALRDTAIGTGIGMTLGGLLGKAYG